MTVMTNAEAAATISIVTGLGYEQVAAAMDRVKPNREPVDVAPIMRWWEAKGGRFFNSGSTMNLQAPVEQFDLQPPVELGELLEPSSTVELQSPIECY